MTASALEIAPTPVRRVLVAYATRNGSTREVAEIVGACLRDEQHLAVDVQPAGDVRSLDGYDGVVLGGAIYMGRWHRDALAFLKGHRRALAALPLVVFALGPKTLEPDDVASSRASLASALAKVPEVVPLSAEIVGGVIDPAKLRFPFNRMPASDARDWDAIHAWARQTGASLARSNC
jgi:menaquinone-dependent protoporphyrinogen oxidase